MSDAIIVFMTAGSSDEARSIANHLVELELAACVQILPKIESVYRWKGEVQHDEELLILAKTTAANFDALEKAVQAIHSYETPEIVAVPVAGISETYRAWLIDNVSAKTINP